MAGIDSRFNRTNEQDTKENTKPRGRAGKKSLLSSFGATQNITETVKTEDNTITDNVHPTTQNTEEQIKQKEPENIQNASDANKINTQETAIVDESTIDESTQSVGDVSEVVKVSDVVDDAVQQFVDEEKDAEKDAENNEIVESVYETMGYAAENQQITMPVNNEVEAATDNYMMYHQMKVDETVIQLANSADPAVIKEYLKGFINDITKNGIRNMAMCIPLDKKTCQLCAFAKTCKKSLAKYERITTSIRISEDVNEALDIMLREDVRFAHTSKSALVTDLITRLVEPYIPMAQKRIDDRKLRELQAKANKQ